MYSGLSQLLVRFYSAFLHRMSVTNNQFLSICLHMLYVNTQYLLTWLQTVAVGGPAGTAVCMDPRLGGGSDELYV